MAFKPKVLSFHGLSSVASAIYKTDAEAAEAQPRKNANTDAQAHINTAVFHSQALTRVSRTEFGAGAGRYTTIWGYRLQPSFSVAFSDLELEKHSPNIREELEMARDVECAHTFGAQYHSTKKNI